MSDTIKNASFKSLLWNNEVDWSEYTNTMHNEYVLIHK